MTNDSAAPWNLNVRGDEVPRLINTDAPILRTEAGPGTGKTFGLARRVVRLLHPKGRAANGSDVLVVAFNRVIAKDLRENIDCELNNSGVAERPEIHTVHALCLRMIGDDTRLLLPHERDAMLYDVLNAHHAIRDEYKIHRTADQALNDHEAEHQKHTTLWQAVCRWLNRHNAHLIGDAPRQVLDRVRGGDFADIQYPYIIVDEYQDLTAAEQELFFRLRAPDGQFVALGDSRQSIYAFRGNDREGLKTLDGWAAQDGCSVVNVPLRSCQRCPGEVVAAANQLMSLSGEEEMLPGSDAEADNHLLYWDSPEQEAQGMARRIIADRATYGPDDRYLVMVTRRNFGFLLRDQLRALDAELHVDLSFEESLLETWPVREAFMFFCLVADSDAPTWRAWLGYKTPDAKLSVTAPQRNADAYLKLLERSADRITDVEVRALAGEERTTPRGSGGANIWDRATRYVALRTAIEQSLAGTAADIIEEILSPRHWNVEEWSDAESAAFDLDALRREALRLLAETEEDDDAADNMGKLRKVARQLRQMIAMREPFDVNEETDVQVSTLWGAKGVTAEHVYVLGLCDEAIPGRMRDEYPGTYAEYVEEQKRLFYVSITRAKKTLVLSRPRQIRTSAAKRLGLRIDKSRQVVTTLRMCQFLRDILDLLPDAQHG